MPSPNKQIVFASGNAGKLREVERLVAPLSFTVVPQSDFDIEPADETGVTFLENALIKARHASAMTGMPALADDSGLCVPYLGGAPGVRSARYAGAQATDEGNVDKLLDAMAGAGDRSAWFHCALVYLSSAEDPAPLVSQARWRGSLLAAPRGEHGFGYDPVFLPQGESRSAAELPAAEKNRVSHRAMALAALAQALAESADHE